MSRLPPAAAVRAQTCWETRLVVALWSHPPPTSAGCVHFNCFHPLFLINGNRLVPSLWVVLEKPAHWRGRRPLRWEWNHSEHRWRKTAWKCIFLFSGQTEMYRVIRGRWILQHFLNKEGEREIVARGGGGGGGESWERFVLLCCFRWNNHRIHPFSSSLFLPPTKQ